MTGNIKVGTLVWQREDDNAVTTKFTILYSYFVPGGKMRMLSPQHWAQTQR